MTMQTRGKTCVPASRPCECSLTLGLKEKYKDNPNFWIGMKTRSLGVPGNGEVLRILRSRVWGCLMHFGLRKGEIPHLAESRKKSSPRSETI